MPCDRSAPNCDDDACRVFHHKLAAWRQRGLSVAPSATPSRSSNRKFVPPATPNNSYERGIPRDSRGMPYLDENGGVMGQREFNSKQRQIEETALARRYHQRESVI